MKKMTGLLSWAILFGLSKLVEALGWTEDSRAFFCLSIVATGIVVILLVITIFFLPGSDSIFYGRNQVFIVALLVGFIVVLGFVMFLSWVVTLLVGEGNISFYEAYQILTLGVGLGHLLYLKKEE